MLSKIYRFHARGGVNYVRQHGAQIRTPEFSLVYLPNERGFWRFAVVVSKKIAKSAVTRNRIRRRFYEALRLELALCQGQPITFAPTDFIFIINTPKLISMPFADLRRQIRIIVDRALESPVQPRAAVV